MVGKGPRVASATIKATVDGDGINKDLVDEVDKAGPGIAKHGDEHGEEYGDHFSDGFEKRFRQNGPKIAGRMRRPARALGESMGEEASQDFSKRMESMMDRLGDRIGKKLGKSIRKTMEKELGGLEQRIGQMIDNLANQTSRVSGNSGGGGGGGGGGGKSATTQYFKENAQRFAEKFESARVKIHDEANAAIAKSDADLVREQESLMKRLRESNAANTEFLARFEAARVKLREGSNKAIGKSDDDLVKRQQRQLADLLAGEKARTDFVGKFVAAREKLQIDSAETVAKFEEANRKAREKDDAAFLKRQQAHFDSLERSARQHLVMLAQAHRMNERFNAGAIDGRGYTRPRGAKGDQGFDLGGLVGKVFGAGSRNNFINVLGSTVGGLTKGMVSLTRAGKTFFSEFSKGFKSLEEGASLMSRFGAGATRAGSGLAAVGASGPGVAIAIGVVAAAAVVLSSILSGLVGIVTALASTIASGLVGALLVVGPAMTAIAAAGGLVAIAFTSMDRQQKKMLKESFIPFKEEVTGLGQLLLRGLLPQVERWSSNLQKALQPIAPYAERIGQAFGRAGSLITNSLSGRGFQKLTESLGTYLPSIVERLSVAFGRFLNGVAAVFSALMPLVNRFSGYLQRVTTDFANWANSTRGQNSIVDFANRAVDSLKSLWGFIRETGGLLADILFNPKVQRSGNRMFDGITRELGKMRAAFAQASSDGSLQRWLDSAARFGKSLWNVVKSLFGTFKVLENSGVLDSISDSLNAVAWVTRLLNSILRPLATAIGNLGPAAVLAVGPLGPLAIALGGLLEVGKAVTTYFGSGQLQSSVGRFINNTTRNLGGVVAAAAGVKPHYNHPGLQASDDGRRHPRRKTPYSTASLIGIGNKALNNTYVKDGGYLPDAETPSQKAADAKAKRDAARAEARRRRQEAAARAKARREAIAARRKELRDANYEAQKAVREFANSRSLSELRSGLQSQMDSFRSLGGRAGRRASRVLRGQGRANENRVDRVLDMDTTAAQRRRLINGTDSLGTLVLARQRVAARLEKANQKLEEAIALRDDFRKSTADALKAYGGILTAEKRTVDGVEQALTANDVTLNLQDRLNKIKKFQDDMRILAEQGLSKAAYQQLIEGGVEGSGDTAAALVAGGSQAIQQVNVLTGQIAKASDALAKTASTRLFQAGVDTARGLVAGLKSMDKELDQAAERMGNRIARAIKRSLGIKSPSAVMIEAMGFVGDGVVVGLDNQWTKVESASARLGQKIKVSPEVAAYAASQGQSPVSGNAPLVDTINVHTPTEDPEGVAHEVLNELVGRL